MEFWGLHPKVLVKVAVVAILIPATPLPSDGVSTLPHNELNVKTFAPSRHVMTNWAAKAPDPRGKSPLPPEVPTNEGVATKDRSCPRLPWEMGLFVGMQAG